jgi:hypothetical protein
VKAVDKCLGTGDWLTDLVPRVLGSLALAIVITLTHPATPGKAADELHGESTRSLPVTLAASPAPADGVTPILTEDTDQATLDSLLSEAMSFIRGMSLHDSGSSVWVYFWFLSFALEHVSTLGM